MEGQANCDVREEPREVLEPTETLNTLDPPALLSALQRGEDQFSRFLSIRDWLSIATTCWGAFRSTEDFINQNFYMGFSFQRKLRHTYRLCVVSGALEKKTETEVFFATVPAPGYDFKRVKKCASCERKIHLYLSYFAPEATSITHMLLWLSRNKKYEQSAVFHAGPFPPNLKVLRAADNKGHAYVHLDSLPDAIEELDIGTACPTSDSFSNGRIYANLASVTMGVHGRWFDFAWEAFPILRRADLRIYAEETTASQQKAFPASLVSLKIRFMEDDSSCTFPPGLKKLEFEGSETTVLPPGLQKLVARGGIPRGALPDGIRVLHVFQEDLLKLDRLPSCLVSLRIVGSGEPSFPGVPYLPPKGLLHLTGFHAEKVWAHPPATLERMSITGYLPGHDSAMVTTLIPPGVKALEFLQIMELHLLVLPPSITEIRFGWGNTKPLGNLLVGLVCLRKIDVGYFSNGGIVTLPRSIELILSRQLIGHIRVNPYQFYMYTDSPDDPEECEQGDYWTFIKRTLTDQPGDDPVPWPDLDEDTTLYQMVPRV